MSDNVQAYPLQWPVGRQRSSERYASDFRQRNRSAHTVEQGVSFVLHELDLMRADDVVISSNIQLRADGLPRSGQPQPGDPGVAVYFSFDERPVCIACDQWGKVQDNIWAVGLTLEAMRGIDRWGAAKLEATFTGYAALPPGPAEEHWADVLGISVKASVDQIRDAYRTKVKVAHPDAGGDHAAFIRVQGAYERAMKERGA